MYLCARSIDRASLSVILLLDLGTVPALWYFLFLFLYIPSILLVFLSKSCSSLLIVFLDNSFCFCVRLSLSSRSSIFFDNWRFDVWSCSIEIPFSFVLLVRSEISLFILHQYIAYYLFGLFKTGYTTGGTSGVGTAYSCFLCSNFQIVVTLFVFFLLLTIVLSELL